MPFNYIVAMVSIESKIRYLVDEAFKVDISNEFVYIQFV